MESSVALGIDIGGTAVKMGLVQDGQVLARARVDTGAFATAAALAQAVARAAAAMPGPRSCAAGLATPGYVRPRDGLLVDGAVNVPQLAGQPLADLFGRHLGLPVTALNDGVAAALGEARHGAARGLDRFVLITLGTGVGGAVMLGGHPVLGSAGEPPELGAIVLDILGTPNAAGLPGTLEDAACVSGFARAYQARGGPPGCAPEAIFARAAAGDPAADAALDQVCRRIAQALGGLVSALNLQACVLGGGIGAAGEPLLRRVREHMVHTTWPFLLARAALRLAERGNDAGLIGAAEAALANRA